MGRMLSMMADCPKQTAQWKGREETPSFMRRIFTVLVYFHRRRVLASFLVECKLAWCRP